MLQVYELDERITPQLINVELPPLVGQVLDSSGKLRGLVLANNPPLLAIVNPAPPLPMLVVSEHLENKEKDVLAFLKKSKALFDKNKNTINTNHWKMELTFPIINGERENIEPILHLERLSKMVLQLCFYSFSKWIQTENKELNEESMELWWLKFIKIDPALNYPKDFARRFDHPLNKGFFNKQGALLLDTDITASKVKFQLLKMIKQWGIGLRQYAQQSAIPFYYQTPLQFVQRPYYAVLEGETALTAWSSRTPQNTHKLYHHPIASNRPYFLSLNNNVFLAIPEKRDEALRIASFWHTHGFLTKESIHWPIPDNYITVSIDRNLRIRNNYHGIKNIHAPRILIFRIDGIIYYNALLL
jgi:hypothetical protein